MSEKYVKKMPKNGENRPFLVLFETPVYIDHPVYSFSKLLRPLVYLNPKSKQQYLHSEIRSKHPFLTDSSFTVFYITTKACIISQPL